MPSADAKPECFGFIKLRRPIKVEVEALGKELPFKLAGNMGVLRTPVLCWRQGPEDRPYLSFQSQTLNELVSRRGDEMDPWLCGSVDEYNLVERQATHAVISAFEVQISVDHPMEFSGYLYGLGRPTGDRIKNAHLASDTWLACFEDWVDVFSDSTILTTGESTRVTAHGQHLSLYSYLGAQTSLPSKENNIIISLGESVATNLDVIRRAALRANDSHELPIAIRLLIRALRAFQEGDVRQAVIDAGTSVELAASHLEIAAIGPDAYSSHSHRTVTLGNLADHLTSKSVPVPDAFFEVITEARNRAVHDARDPGHAQCLEALETARVFVLRAFPISTL